ncbi:MAG TPA: hypothetical protein VFE55_14495 [Acidimicrobiia bacterium]|nr:hypothetical protein [Acidimicrobiia bacterium]
MRWVAGVALTCALLLIPRTPAHARGVADTVCDNDGCDATATSSHDGWQGTNRQYGSNPITCRYKNMGLDPQYTLIRPDGSVVQGDGTGQWFERQCVDSRELAKIDDAVGPNADEASKITAIMQQVQAVQRQPVYIRNRQVPELIDEARSRLVFPLLTPRSSPASPWTYVNYPTALWLDGDASSRTATAEAPGVRVTVSATLEEVRWETGDGAVEVCRGPGRPPDPNVSGDHGDCSHVWSWPSSGQPQSAYQVTATSLWRVTWTAEGAPGGGDLGLVPQRSVPVAVRVAEIQTLNIEPPR